jgi:hypothetical protein
VHEDEVEERELASKSLLGGGHSPCTRGQVAAQPGRQADRHYCP